MNVEVGERVLDEVEYRFLHTFVLSPTVAMSANVAAFTSVVPTGHTGLVTHTDTGILHEPRYHVGCRVKELEQEAGNQHIKGTRVNSTAIRNLILKGVQDGLGKFVTEHIRDNGIFILIRGMSVGIRLTSSHHSQGRTQGSDFGLKLGISPLARMQNRACRLAIGFSQILREIVTDTFALGNTGVIAKLFRVDRVNKRVGRPIAKYGPNLFQSTLPTVLIGIENVPEYCGRKRLGINLTTIERTDVVSNHTFGNIVLTQFGIRIQCVVDRLLAFFTTQVQNRMVKRCKQHHRRCTVKIKRFRTHTIRELVPQFLVFAERIEGPVIQETVNHLDTECDCQLSTNIRIALDNATNTLLVLGGIPESAVSIGLSGRRSNLNGIIQLSHVDDVHQEYRRFGIISRYVSIHVKRSGGSFLRIVLFL